MDRAEGRREQRVLRAAGCAVLRVMHTELNDDLAAVVREIGEALSVCAARSAR